jgi:hypothetical protein
MLSAWMLWAGVPGAGLGSGGPDRRRPLRGGLPDGRWLERRLLARRLLGHTGDAQLGHADRS